MNWLSWQTGREFPEYKEQHIYHEVAQDQRTDVDDDPVSNSHHDSPTITSHSLIPLMALRARVHRQLRTFPLWLSWFRYNTHNEPVAMCVCVMLIMRFALWDGGGWLWMGL